MRTPYLFARVDVFSVSQHQTSQLKAEIDQLNQGTLANVSEQELVHDLAAKYKFEVPVLEEESASTSYREVNVDVSQDPMRMIFNRGRPFYVKGTEITITVPFKGDGDMFQIRPSTHNLNPSQGEVQGTELLLKYTRTDNNSAAVKTDYERTLGEIKKHLQWLEQSVADFNGKIGQQIQELVTARKQKLEGAARMVADIGLPVKQKGTDDIARPNVAKKAVSEGTRSPKKWDVFISHASEDKDKVARPLALSLRNRGISVWYDEFSLKLGDSLRSSIDYGLANSRYGVVILSKKLFAKHWPAQELNGLASKEVDGKKVILPVWHDVNVEEVRGFSPILADRIAGKSDEGLDKVVLQIINALEED